MRKNKLLCSFYLKYFAQGELADTEMNNEVPTSPEADKVKIKDKSNLTDVSFNKQYCYDYVLF